jgi:hypothetical protein
MQTPHQPARYRLGELLGFGDASTPVDVAPQDAVTEPVHDLDRPEP